jgi:CHAT domain-containing protein
VRRLIALAATLGLLADCQTPPPSAYVGTHDTSAVSLGTNAVGETCTQDAGPGAREAAIYCGTWDQPAAHTVRGAAATPGSLAELATDSPWRVGLDRRVNCTAPPVPTEVLGQPALLLRCARRIGGWPHMALVSIVGGRAWYADGVAPALPAMQRSIGVLSGQLSGSAVAALQISPALAAQRLASSDFSAGDMGQYETWMRTATMANRAGSYAAAEAAYRSVAALQRKVLGPNTPALSRTLASEAVQASNLGRYAEADALLDQAEHLARAPGQSDDNAAALVWHYRGLNLLNQGKPEAALAMLRRAEAAYTANLKGAPLIPVAAAATGRRSSAASAIATQDLLDNAAAIAAITGVIETKRAEAVALERLNRLGESQAAAESARQVAVANGLDAPSTMARLLRTSAFVAEANGDRSTALTRLESSDRDFAAALPGSVAYAKTTLLLAARQAKAGNATAALQTCRDGIAALRTAGLGSEPALLQPCLALMDAAADGPEGDAVRVDMFEAAELAQGSVTSAQIAEASARLSENARDPRVAALIRARADLTAELSDLVSQRQDLPAGQAGTGAGAAPQDSGLDARIAKARADLADKNSALQAASPQYGSLVQLSVSARQVLAALHPHEAFCSIMLGPDAGWSFLLRDGHVYVARIQGGAARMAALVSRVRASLDTETMPPPPFDIAAAAELYQAIFGAFANQMRGATALTVAPTGPLLSIPFGLLLTGPASPDALAAAPWLVRQVVVSHVPAPANFVSLRKLEGTSRATSPWFGFGDFRPVTLAQAEASFPPASCGDSARLLVGLPKLPGAELELETVRRLSHAPASDQLLGPAFTADAVLHANLKNARILYFATHALLATDLKCQTEPALVTSAPPRAKTAVGALLTASQVTRLDLDADAVILSACNTGGAAGGEAGESLSGLARSFFYAGARSLLVTHWAVNDRVTAYLVAVTVAKAQGDPSLGMAGGLALAQRSMLADAKGDLAGQAHPFYWAPLALIGDGQARL